MSRRRFYFAGLFAGMFLIAVGSAAAAELSASDRALLYQALALNRVPDALELANRQLKQEIESDQRFGAMPADARLKLKEIIFGAFDPHRILEDIANDVAVSFERSHFEAFVRAYSTPLAQKMSGLIVAAATPEGKAGMFSFVQELRKTPPDAERVALLLQLDDLTKSSEIEAEFSMALFGAMGGVSRDDPRYVRMLEEARTSTRNSVLVKRLYACRAVTIEEMQEFVQLHTRPHVAEVSQVIDRAASRSVQTMLRRFMERMMALDEENRVQVVPAPDQKK